MVWFNVIRWSVILPVVIIIEYLSYHIALFFNSSIREDLLEGHIFKVVIIVMACKGISTFCAVCVGITISPSYKKYVAIGLGIFYILGAGMGIGISLSQRAYSGAISDLGILIGLLFVALFIHEGELPMLDKKTRSA
ncbi:MAG: hypothetical protein ABII09_00370 [Planctomycetota bacterium]